MNQVFVLTALLSVCTLGFSSLVGNNRYGAPHSGNSLNYRGGNHNRYPAGPHAPAQPHSPVAPRAPAHQSYGAPRSPSYGGRHQAAPYAGARQHRAPAAPQYNAPSHYGSAGHVPYGPQAHASIPSHYSNSKRSVYQQPQHSAPNYNSGPSRSGYAQPQTYSQSHQSAESRSQTHGREMKYTVRDPQNRGTTHVSETHVVSNRQMHGAEAEAAMKKLMGSMGPASSDNGFQDLIKGMGLPFY